MLFLACSNPELSNCVITLEDCSDLELRAFARTDSGEEVATAECECREAGNPVEKNWLTQFKLLQCDRPNTISSWTSDLDGFTLYHTRGLRDMALSGSVGRLDDEYCNAGLRNKRIPSGLGDDFERVGYASVLELNGYLIAMYHPTQLHPDNWIQYRIDDGSWERWDLNGAKPFLRSSSND